MMSITHELGSIVYVIAHTNSNTNSMNLHTDIDNNLYEIYFIECQVKGIYLNSSGDEVYHLKINNDNIAPLIRNDSLDISVFQKIRIALEYTDPTYIYKHKDETLYAANRMVNNYKSEINKRHSQVISGVEKNIYIKEDNKTLIHHIHTSILKDPKVHLYQLQESKNFLRLSEIESQSFKLKLDNNILYIYQTPYDSDNNFVSIDITNLRPHQLNIFMSELNSR